MEAKMKKVKKTIGITIRFWTNDLPDGFVGKKRQACWGCGNVHLESNPTKGIRNDNIIFNSFDEVPLRIQELFIRNKILMLVDMAREKRALMRLGKSKVKRSVIEINK